MMMKDKDLKEVQALIDMGKKRGFVTTDEVSNSLPMHLISSDNFDDVMIMFSEQDIEAYLASGEWRGKAGGYAAQGLAGSFIVKIVGSYTNIVGLPLYETATLLSGENFPIHFGWLNAG